MAVAGRSDMPVTSPVQDRVTAARARVVRQLRTLVSGLQHSARAVEARSGVTNAQLFVLRQLAEGTSLSITELAERLRARPNAVSALVRRLVDSGLVRRIVDPDDARRAAVSITASGRRVVKRAPLPPVEQLLAGLEQLDERDIHRLSRGLAKLVVALGLSPDDAPFLFEDGRA